MKKGKKGQKKKDFGSIFNGIINQLGGLMDENKQLNNEHDSLLQKNTWLRLNHVLDKFANLIDTASKRQEPRILLKDEMSLLRQFEYAAGNYIPFEHRKGLMFPDEEEYDQYLAEKNREELHALILEDFDLFLKKSFIYKD